MKTKKLVAIRRLLYCIVLIFSLFLYSCKKDKEQSPTPSSTSTGSPAEPQSGDVLYNAVMDIDGHMYDAVLIGNKTWMIQNLKTTRYANGEEIPVGVAEEDRSYTEPFRYVPNGEGNNVFQYGYLYNWPAVMHGENSSSGNPSNVQGICPHGWHVPSKAEWEQLTTLVGLQSQYQCNNDRNNIAKSLASTSGWKEAGKDCAVGNNQSSNNTTHFSAYPAGYGDQSINNNFSKDAYFWSCTKASLIGGETHAYSFELDYYSAIAYTSYAPYKASALAVRCVKD